MRRHSTRSQAVFRSIRISSFGVLGEGMDLSGKIVAVEADPAAAGCAIVDPAGLHHIQPPGGPSGAGGAAGSIYRWLGIDEHTRFPPRVISAIKHTGDAKYHPYDLRGKRVGHVIHVVGPDFRNGVRSWDVAATELGLAYRNVFAEFIGSQLETLRLLPISAGIFAGPFLPRMPVLTAVAVRKGLEGLDTGARESLGGKGLQMCIFAEKDVPSFYAAFAAAQVGHC